MWVKLLFLLASFWCSNLFIIFQFFCRSQYFNSSYISNHSKTLYIHFFLFLRFFYTSKHEEWKKVVVFNFLYFSLIFKNFIKLVYFFLVPLENLNMRLLIHLYKHCNISLLQFMILLSAGLFRCHGCY